MSGTTSTEFKLIRDSLVGYHQALERHITGTKFESLFFEVFGCYETDTSILDKTDFGRFRGSVAVINGLTKPIVELGRARK